MNIGLIFLYVFICSMIAAYIAIIFIIGYAVVCFALYLRKKMEKEE